MSHPRSQKQVQMQNKWKTIKQNKLNQANPPTVKIKVDQTTSAKNWKSDIFMKQDSKQLLSQIKQLLDELANSQADKLQMTAKIKDLELAMINETQKVKELNKLLRQQQNKNERQFNVIANKTFLINKVSEQLSSLLQQTMDKCQYILLSNISQNKQPSVQNSYALLKRSIIKRMKILNGIVQNYSYEMMEVGLINFDAIIDQSKIKEPTQQIFSFFMNQCQKALDQSDQFDNTFKARIYQCMNCQKLLQIVEQFYSKQINKLQLVSLG